MALTKQEFREQIWKDSTTLIDVRTTEEQIKYWVISDTQTHIDISQPDAVVQIQKLPITGKYLIYCWHGVRSKQIVTYMKSLWFTDVDDLEGGIDIWNS